MSIHSKEKEIVNAFSQFSNWEDRYKLVITKGKEITSNQLLPDSEKVEDLMVKGCQSQVWLKADFKDGKLFFRGDSDALIVKGLLSILLYVYSGESANDILGATSDFIKELGFEKHLSPSRANGLFSMMKQIKFYAMAFQLKNRS